MKARMELAAAIFFTAIFMTAMIFACTTTARELPEPTAETVISQIAEETYASRSVKTASTTASTAPEEPELLYDIPLSDELQRFIREQCKERGVPFEIALALIDHESGYQAEAESPTDDYGLMQINSCNHGWLAEELGLTDMLDPRQNITAGVYILGKAFETYGDPNQALMAYNMGDAGMRHAWEQGCRSTKYSRSIIEAASLLKAR